MKYLCIVYYEERALDTLTKGDYDALTTETRTYNEQLRQAGHLVAAHALQPARTATSVRIRDGRPTTVDGPYVETKEQVGGFILIDARDLNEAIQLATNFPPTRLGGIEVRPIRELP